MKRAHVLLALVILLSACGPRPEVGNKISSCGEKVDAVASLIAGLDFPANFQVENPLKTGTEFDLMQYFTILDHLSMQPGYLLDYVYHFDGMGGYPFLYARPASQLPYATEADLPAGSNGTKYLEYVRSDDTPEGYFQFVLLSLMGSQFYLYWHADYNDTQIVCDRTGVRRIVSSLNGDFGYRISIASRVRAFLLNDVSPTVLISDETVKVQFVTFTRWGGFFQQTYTISRSMPYTIQELQKKNLIPYECGVMF